MESKEKEHRADDENRQFIDLLFYNPARPPLTTFHTGATISYVTLDSHISFQRRKTL